MKRTILFTCIFLFLVANVFAVDEPQPVLYFSFDGDSGDEVEDLSGNGNDGAISGDGDFVEGKYSKGLSLGKPDYVRVPHSETLVIGDELTVGIWVSLTDTANQKVIGKSPTASGFVIGVNGGIYPECWPQGGAVLTATQGSIPVDTWTHLALTYSAETEEMISYINGEEVGRLSNGGNPLGQTNLDLLIGVAPWDPNQWQSAGVYDDVKVYNVALDADQVMQMMGEGIGAQAVSPGSKTIATWGSVKN